MASSTPKVTVELETIMPKKKVARFETDNEDAPLTNIYLGNKAVQELGGCENGVKVTITPL